MHFHQTIRIQTPKFSIVAVAVAMMFASGCANLTGNKEINFAAWEPAPIQLAGLSQDDRIQRLANLGDGDKSSHSHANSAQARAQSPQQNTTAQSTTAQDTYTQTPKSKISSYQVMRAQSPDDNAFGSGQTGSQGSTNRFAVQQSGGVSGLGQSDAGSVQKIGTSGTQGSVQQTAFQYPELSAQGANRSGLNSPNVGSPNELNPLDVPYQRDALADFPMNYADLDVYVAETQTGRINFGGAYNSDNGIVGQFTIDEKNFDIWRFPRSFQEILDGTAWRGAGQQFRLEIVPGANLERYLVSFSEPYFRGTDFSFSASGYLFTRQYFDWDEKRLGGRFAFGRRLDQDLSISAGLRMESVTVDNARVNTSNELNASLGNNNLFLGNIGLVRDTRDSAFAATTGSYLSATYSQAFGDFSYARGDIDYRRYRLLYERPDGSGRHTLSFGSKAGFSGSSTPIFENYFAGGFSTMRGFDFRGAAPLENGVRVGGEFQWLNSLEYTFPLTADDMIKGVLFCDFGTVEESIELNAENFRVAPGFGFRINMPSAGIGAPLAFDFAFPVASAVGEDENVLCFYLGMLR